MADFDLGSIALRGVDRNIEVCIAQIQRVDERAALKQVGVVDDQPDFIDPRDHPLAVAFVEDAHLLRHDAAEWLHSQPGQRQLHSPLVEFERDEPLPFVGKAFIGRIPTGHEESGEQQAG